MGAYKKSGRLLLVSITAIALLPACGGVDEEPTSDLPLFDEKADSPTNPLLVQLIDGAKSRIAIKFPNLNDSKLQQHLTDAVGRGVVVSAYMVAKTPGSGQAVLNSEGLEASGVDINVVRDDGLAGFTAISESQVIVATGKKFKLHSDATQAAALGDTFATATKEDWQAKADALPRNSARLLLMPESTGAQIVALIGNATKTIDLEIYQLQDPAVTAALVAAKKRGVTVRVMLEPKTVGSQNYDPESAILTAAGIMVQVTPPAFDSHRNVDHAKFMIVDGAELIYGSGNLVRSGLGGNSASEFCNRDFWLRDRRATSVSEAVKLFQADWSRQSTTAITFQNLVLTPDNADDRLLALFKGAQKRLYVYNQSLNDSDLIDNLIAAKTRGADVQVLLGYQPGYGSPPANQPAIDKLTAAGISAGYYTRNYLHGKAVVADGQVFIGSQNFTSGGLRNNRELGEIFQDAAIVEEIADQFLADKEKPTP